MSNKRFTFIATVFNEAENINKFLNSIYQQTCLPDEIIIVDGGSTDNTVNIIKKISQKHSLKIKLLEKRGNRSVGRNLAVKNASCDIILCSDAGCILDRDWVKNITRPFTDNTVDIVAGYYQGRANTIFEKCVIPYALVMPDRVNPHNFLPATRSMAFRKSVWKQLHGFDESLSHNEDYAFSRRLVKYKKKIIFVQNAVVEWLPPQNIKTFTKMIFRFALGDSQAGIFRPKVGLIFLRYLLLILLLINLMTYSNIALLVFIIAAILFYLIWSFSKNFKYVNDLRALYILPVLQVVSDLSVILGTLWGSMYYLEKKSK